MNGWLKTGSRRIGLARRRVSIRVAKLSLPVTIASILVLGSTPASLLAATPTPTPTSTAAASSTPTATQTTTSSTATATQTSASTASATPTATRTAAPLRPFAVPSATLGTATSFSVLGGTTVTNTGPTTMIGD